MNVRRLSAQNQSAERVQQLKVPHELMTQSFLELFGEAASNQQQMQQEIAGRLRSVRLFEFNSRNVDDFGPSSTFSSARAAAKAATSRSLGPS